MAEMIHNKKLIKQVLDFNGVDLGEKRHPTDIDSFLEFHNKVFIFIEIKHKGKDIETGQRLALERLCDCCKDSGKFAIVLHGTHDTDNDIDLATCNLKKFYYNGKWTYKTGWNILKTIKWVMARNDIV